MFSKRSLVLLLAVAAAATALPADPAEGKTPPKQEVEVLEDDGDIGGFFSFSPFPLLNNFFVPLFKWFPRLSTEVGPVVDIDDDRWRISISVKDYPKDALKVKVKNGFLIVQGSRDSVENEHSVFASQFFHTYSLPANASAADVTAELSNDGWLTVNAPLTADGATRGNEGERIVEIKETGAPYQKPEKKPELEKKPETEKRESEKNPDSGKTRDREEVTNSIPHGEKAASI